MTISSSESQANRTRGKIFRKSIADLAKNSPISILFASSYRLCPGLFGYANRIEIGKKFIAKSAIDFEKISQAPDAPGGGRGHTPQLKNEKRIEKESVYSKNK